MKERMLLGLSVQKIVVTGTKHSLGGRVDSQRQKKRCDGGRQITYSCQHLPAVIRDHNPRGEKQHKFLILQFCRSEV